MTRVEKTATTTAAGIFGEAACVVSWAEDSAFSEACKKKIEEYLRWELLPSNRLECLKLLENATGQDQVYVLERCFLRRLEFGTAGLRGRMGVGFACMNDLTVIQATQGLSAYLVQRFGRQACSARGVVLGFDGRHNSERFANAAAAVLLSRNFKVYLNSRVTATPMCPYAVVLYGCVGGIQITASHNPKSDNGYKVYADNGAQIVPPMDSEISKCILDNLEPWPEVLKLLDFHTRSSSCGMLTKAALSRVVDCYAHIFRSYINDMTADLCCFNGGDAIRAECITTNGITNTTAAGTAAGTAATSILATATSIACTITNPHTTTTAAATTATTTTTATPHTTTTGATTPYRSSSSLKIVYTAMHGVGYPYVKELLRRFGFPMENFYPVEEQKLPDPEFSTVSYPNPEENGAMDMGIALAEKVGASMVIANDPDADRFACVERQKDGSWKVFHGDELGILFGVEALARLSAKGVPARQMLFVCSAVSSRMLQRMAETEGARFEETLTGFKWMMNRAVSLARDEGCIPALVYEEALGYGLNVRVPDKDGISAAAVWVQAACRLHRDHHGMTMGEMLTQLRRKYGYFVTNNRCLLCHDREATARLFVDFRTSCSSPRPQFCFGDAGQQPYAAAARPVFSGYPDSIGTFKIKRMRDVAAGFDSGQADGRCTFPLTASGEMLTIFFENGAVLTLRTSGTEPKLKWYSEMSSRDEEAAKRDLQAVVDATIRHVIQPQKYGLTLPVLQEATAR